MTTISTAPKLYFVSESQETGELIILRFKSALFKSPRLSEEKMYVHIKYALPASTGEYTKKVIRLRVLLPSEFISQATTKLKIYPIGPVTSANIKVFLSAFINVPSEKSRRV